jgi:para-aminobenzoate synthetase/4-amino-4-deoxychorismate lyase
MGIPRADQLLQTELLDQQDICILLETCKYDQENSRSYLFTDPVDIISLDSGDDIEAFFEQIAVHLQRHYVAGFFAYELGYALDGSRHFDHSASAPLARVAVFDKVKMTSNRRQQQIPVDPGYRITDLQLEINREMYAKKIAQIKQYIESGDTYQINFTSRYKFGFEGEPYLLYRILTRKQPVAYSAFIKWHDLYILSLSPELFFRKRGEEVVMRPMKGTFPKGKSIVEDRQQMTKFAADIKNRSENVMIVDLIRNDLGRIARTGTVATTELFAVEKFSTLLQMTSTVKCRLREQVTLFEFWKSLFPSGSVTGAPKISSMRIIQELESEARGVYTGSIGFFSPDDEAVFNVAIRTLTIRHGRGEMGIGSGIVYDSDIEQEYQECQLKAQFLTGIISEFSLLETMRLQKGYHRLDLHLQRLHQTAEYFEFVCDIPMLKQRLLALAKPFSPHVAYKVRLLLAGSGAYQLFFSRLSEDDQSGRMVTLSSTRTSSSDLFLYHKTTNRDLYDREYKQYSRLGFFDVLYRNERGEITEGAISNVFIKRGADFYTPPLECGVLDGVYRRAFIKDHTNVYEKVLTVDDLVQADAIFLCNSVRGMVEVNLVVNKNAEGQ